MPAVTKQITGIRTIEFAGEQYPIFQTDGNAARFTIPFALEVCTGVGYDLCYGRSEWKLPGAIGVDTNDPDERLQNAMSLPDMMVDFCFCSHGLEHLPHWVNALDHWTSRLKRGGILYLYLPDYSQKYWRPWANRKHSHVLQPHIIKDYLEATGYTNIFVSGVDLNNSFTIMAQKI